MPINKIYVQKPNHLNLKVPVSCMGSGKMKVGGYSMGFKRHTGGDISSVLSRTLTNLHVSKRKPKKFINL
jgi:hypothetical protein